MEWTRKYPTTEGWYWLRTIDKKYMGYPAHEQVYIRHQPQTTQISEDYYIVRAGESIEYSFTMMKDDEIRYLHEWYGPLEIPE